MIIANWIATALLAASWLFGLDYFYPACSWMWLLLVSAAIILFTTTSTQQKPCKTTNGNYDVAALVILLVVVAYTAWPYRLVPLLMFIGIASRRVPFNKKWLLDLSQGTIASSVILLAQALTLELYKTHTARTHDLRWPVPDLLAGVAWLLGIDATADGSSVVMHSMRQVHRLAVTWEMVLDPATLLFFVGGIVMLALTVNATNQYTSARRYWTSWLHSVRVLAIIIVCWLPVRAGLLMALYLHRVLRSDPNQPLHAMNHFFSPWILLALLVVPLLLAWRFIAKSKAIITPDKDLTCSDECLKTAESDTSSSDVPPPKKMLPLAGLVALSVFLATMALYWNPVGSRREGRVVVVERHSEWEPTTKAYDTSWYGELSGYNYAAIYDYLGQYYQMSRLLENDKIDEHSLANCDVLIIKTPTARYSPAEVDAVLKFVEQGGGLLLIGDHTNFERGSTIMNDITRRIGFIFRDDLLFGFGESPYDQYFVPPKPSHPSLNFMPPMDFAVSCSIDPGFSNGRSVIANTGLWSMGPEYHNSNFHPIPQHCPEMRYGAFIQAWAAWHGKGRVLAFGDSTIFSSFCTFQPGRAELMLGMVEWLNHANPPLNPRPWLLILTAVALATTFALYHVSLSQWLLLLIVAQLGWVMGSLATTALHNWQMPLPQSEKPLPTVVIDRTTSTVPLAKGMFVKGEGKGYGMLEAWIARLGCITVRKTGDEAFSGDALLIICPNRSIPEQFWKKVEQYVADGGKLLVIDAPENVGSTANSLLWPFGLSINHNRAWQGKLVIGGNLPQLEVAAAKEVVGGEPLGTIGKYQVGAMKKYKKGVVAAIGYGSLWNDQRMSEYAPAGAEETAWMMEPDAKTLERYNVLFAALRAFLDGKPLPTTPPEQKKSPGNDKPIKELPIKESGPAEF